MRNNPLITVAALTLLSVCVGPIMFVARPAEAHAEVARSTPEEGARVAPGLREIVITFTEDVSLDQSSAEVVGPSGVTLADTSAEVDRADRRVMRITMHPLAIGAYTVNWRAVTEDDNAITNGQIHFNVTEDAPAAANAGELPLRLLVAATIVLAGFVYIAIRRGRK